VSDVFERTTAALTSLSTPFACDRFIPASGSELPDLFMAFFMVSSVAGQHADNSESERVERVQVSVFSRTGLSGLPDVDLAMTAAGFKPGPKRQLPFDMATGHFGLAQDYFGVKEKTT
jgi:hypothetical protein